MTSPRSAYPLRDARPRARLRVGLTTLAASALLLGATACGTTQPSADAETAGGGAEPTAAGPITLTDGAGRTVELPEPAQDVVVLEWQMVEGVLTLGVEPVGVADVEGYNTWDSAEPLDSDVADVGKRGEPNLDAIFSTDPDLVITEVYGPDDAVVEQLEEYDVPVLAVLGADAEDPIAQVEETFGLIAEALGRTEEAEAAWADFDAAIEEGRAAVEEADPEVTDFVYVDGYVQGSTLSLRPFGQGSYVGEIGEELGLTNAWKGEVDPAYGLGSTDAEGLASVEDAWLLHTGTEAGGWVGELEGNAVWEGSDFVTEDRVRAFPEGIWTFGGPRSGMQVVEAFVAAVS